MTEQEIKDINDAAPFGHSTMRGKIIPEGYVSSGNETFSWRLNGREVKVSGGFMEQSGHGLKNFDTFYLDSNNPNPNTPAVRAAGARYNIGIDYVVGGDEKVTPWYSGVVEKAGLDGGYGYAVRVKTDYSYEYEGKRYPIYTQYSHLRDTPSVQVGQRVNPSTEMATMGGTGGGGVVRYPEHVDFQSYIVVDGKKIQVSPNLMQDNLSQQAVRGTLRSSQNSSENAQTAENYQPSSRPPSADLNIQQIDSQVEELYTKLYNLAVGASGGDNRKIIEYLRTYGENGTSAYAYNSPNTRGLTEENQRLAAAKAFEVPAASSLAL